MRFVELMKEIQERYAHYFPNSSVTLNLTGSLYPTLYVLPRLARSLDEVSGRIIGNDMFHIQISITYVNKPLQKAVQIDSDILEELEIAYDSSFYVIKPDSPHMAYGSRKVPARKSHGSPEKIIKTLDAYFDKLRASLCKDMLIGEIHPNFMGIVQSKL